MLSMRDMVLQGYTEAEIQDYWEVLPIMVACHTCKKNTIEDDGTHLKPNMWLCYECIKKIASGEIGSPP